MAEEGRLGCVGRIAKRGLSDAEWRVGFGADIHRRFSDPNSAADLTTVQVLFNTEVAAAHGCYVIYNPLTKQLYLTDDAGTGQSSGLTPGSAATVSNSQCTLSGTGSSYITSGNTANLALALQFTGTASVNVYLDASEVDGTSTGWVLQGTWLP